ncbi:RNA polymerase factor sigma-32 [Nioella ostreopsis]|jgi:RNA polymerase sigma-32 factor|uniref:RNA polymerase factor sigma-32 n=1 Tax=Nioella ostreopsis TaxID=2448479 RepID=UPI000FD76D87|nr:RNA polymerase factor sigma-32 [Nioella ostreopsis]
MALDFDPGQSLSRHARSAELLDAETERDLAIAWRDHRDEAALHRLITAYMRLAISIAWKFKGYGASVNDLIQEAGLGLMKAADRFDPDRGVRFSTYAVWWIRAGMQDFVMRNWSMVRTGSTSSQKSLFFNMRRVRARLEADAAAEGVELDSNQLRERIASEIGVALKDVELMEGRLAGSDFSLNALQSDGDEGREWIETLEDDGEQASERFEREKDGTRLREWLGDALGTLTEREQKIIAARKLTNPARTLESLGEELGLSKERVRQIEAGALQKMRRKLAPREEELRGMMG